MAKISFLWVGKTKEPWIKNGIEIYLKKIKHFVKIDVHTLKDTKRDGRSREASIVDAIPRDSFCVILDERGRSFTSEAFSKFISQRLTQPPNHIVFLLGGPYGLSPATKDKGDFILSLSPMTFTHEMARVILLEQVYRALTIEKGLPYHH